MGFLSCVNECWFIDFNAYQINAYNFCSREKKNYYEEKYVFTATEICFPATEKSFTATEISFTTTCEQMSLFDWLNDISWLSYWLK